MEPAPLRILTAIAALLASVVAVAVLDRPAVDVGTALTELNDHLGGSARSGETVRYDSPGLALVSTHQVRGGVVTDAEQLAPRERGAWAAAAAVMPPAELARIRQLNFVTDGVAGTLGMVHRSTADRDQWIVSLDAAESDAVLAQTMIHELAHVHTLGAADVMSGDRTGCSALVMAIGCVRRGSVLARWYHDLWAERPEPAAFDPDEFVSDYAATSAHEDLAETFLYWVQDDIASTPALRAKVAFLEHEPDLVALRDAIRVQLAGHGA